MLNRLLPTRNEALHSRAVDLHFRRCDDVEGCGFVWNAAFDVDSATYAPGYVNDQSQSAGFRSHLAQVRVRIAKMAESAPGEILEIGCGQGDFLRELCAITNRAGVGFDPAFDVQSERNPSRPLSRGGGSSLGDNRVSGKTGHGVRVHQAVFDDAAIGQVDGQASVVICRHVLEHLPNPLLAMTHASRVLHRDGSLYVEVPCVDWIVESSAFYDFFHEHCSLFSPRSLRRALSEAGFSGIRINRVFGGQYLAAEARFEKLSGADLTHDVVVNADAVCTRRSLSSAMSRFKDEIDAELAVRPVLVWGAGAKGVSLVNHLHLDSSRIPALIDIHPFKQGLFVPISGQQVIAPIEVDRFLRDESLLILVMNPNYAGEIRRTLNELRIDAEVRVMDGRPRVALHC